MKYAIATMIVILAILVGIMLPNAGLSAHDREVIAAHATQCALDNRSTC